MFMDTQNNDRQDRYYMFILKYFNELKQSFVTTEDILNHEFYYALQFFTHEQDHIDTSVIDNYDHMEEVIEDIQDQDYLLTLITLQWRSLYLLGHTMDRSKDWFLLAFERLVFLNRKNIFYFRGVPQKVTLISYHKNVFLIDRDIKQIVTLHSNGYVKAVNYILDENGNEKISKETEEFLNVSVMSDLLEDLAKTFHDYDDELTTDDGQWNLSIENHLGIEYEYYGPFVKTTHHELKELSEVLRELLDDDSLYIFDGEPLRDRMERIQIDYHRHTELHLPRFENSQKTVDLHFQEHIMIDRETETLEWTYQISPQCHICHSYHIQDGISYLLDQCSAFDFHDKEELLDDVIDSHESKDYVITINYKYQQQTQITGSFDSQDLPKDYVYFAKLIQEFIEFYGFGEMLNPYVYSQLRHTKGDHIYCKVVFEQSAKTYYYLTDDESICVGDYVIVPVGKDNHEEVVQVVDIEYYQEDTPFPLEKTKKIIAKYQDVELVS